MRRKGEIYQKTSQIYEKVGGVEQSAQTRERRRYMKPEARACTDISHPIRKSLNFYLYSQLLSAAYVCVPFFSLDRTHRDEEQQVCSILDQEQPEPPQVKDHREEPEQPEMKLWDFQTCCGATLVQET